MVRKSKIDTDILVQSLLNQEKDMMRKVSNLKDSFTRLKELKIKAENARDARVKQKFKLEKLKEFFSLYPEIKGTKNAEKDFLKWFSENYNEHQLNTNTDSDIITDKMVGKRPTKKQEDEQDLVNKISSEFLAENIDLFHEDLHEFLRQKKDYIASRMGELMSGKPVKEKAPRKPRAKKEKVQQIDIQTEIELPKNRYKPTDMELTGKRFNLKSVKPSRRSSYYLPSQSELLKSYGNLKSTKPSRRSSYYLPLESELMKRRSTLKKTKASEVSETPINRFKITDKELRRRKRKLKWVRKPDAEDTSSDEEDEPLDKDSFDAYVDQYKLMHPDLFEDNPMEFFKQSRKYAKSQKGKPYELDELLLAEYKPRVVYDPDEIDEDEVKIIKPKKPRKPRTKAQKHIVDLEKIINIPTPKRGNKLLNKVVMESKSKVKKSGDGRVLDTHLEMVPGLDKYFKKYIQKSILMGLMELSKGD